jgi:hypothetical protein
MCVWILKTSEVLLPFLLILYLLIEDRLDTFLFKLFTYLVILVLDVVVSFGCVWDRDYFPHFFDDSSEMNKAIAEYTDLKIVTHRTEKTIELAVEM